VADANGIEVVTTVLKWLGGAGGLAVLGVIVNARRPGAGQEKDLRDGLSDRNESLEKLVTQKESQVNALTLQRDRWRYLCLQARLDADTVRMRHGDPPGTWPPDPPDPPGGTP